MIIKDIEQKIPYYYTKEISEDFLGIYSQKSHKLVSVVSSKYKLVQSRDLFKEILLQLKDYNFIKYTLKTNYKTHYLYLRMEFPGYTQKFMMILVNSVDKSNAVKFLVGVYEQLCANDLIITSWIYFKHIGQTEEKSKALKIFPGSIIMQYKALENKPNFLDERILQRLKGIIYLDEKITKEILALPNIYEVYNIVINFVNIW